MEWHAVKKEDVLKELKSNEKGINDKEAEIRLKKNGRNIIEETYKISPVKIFIKQFQSYIVYVLLAATIISFIIRHYLDASVILAIVFLNAGLGFAQQYKAEKSILELKKLMVPKSKVMRNGKLRVISSAYLVPGDILVLESGDCITADSRILGSENLEVNEAVLTGESLPVEKSDELLSQNASLAERKNMLYAGTAIVNGNCRAIVVSTGMKTEFGKIASTLQQIEIPKTPMQKKMDKFAKQVTIFIVFITILLSLIGILGGQNKFDMFLMSVALVTSAIPEGLPAVITIGLAFATKRMLLNKVIVRRLPAAETLGSVTVICSDKTGTITEEKMTVTKIFCDNKFYDKDDSNLIFGNEKIKLTENKTPYQLIKTSILCNNARFEKREITDGKIVERYEIIGDSTESALVLSALKLGIDKKILSIDEPRIKEFSFTSSRKMMSILRKGPRRNILYSKGASSAILRRCYFELTNGKIQKLNLKRRNYLMKISEKMESEALRVLAFAFRNTGSEEDIERGLIFLGFIGMQDPPRKEVKRALEICKNAGIKIKIITGDSALTAKAIASKIGIEGKMLTGQELEGLSDEALKKEINNVVIFARTDPKQKLRIVEILKLQGEQVAITGDGINDVLALKKADIGIAMGRRGSDVAREVSDMILMDDNFASIVQAVEEGRVFYNNTKKMTKYLFAVNFSEILLVLYTVFAGVPLPFLPIQILWMNLVTDSIPALSLVKERDKEVMNEKPKREKSILDGMLLFVIIAGILTFLVEIVILLLTINTYPIEKVRTLIVTGDIFFELFFIFTCRSNKNLGEIGFFSNKYLVYSVLIASILQLIAIYSPLNTLFLFTPLSIKDWLLILPLALSGLVIFEVAKYFKKK